jgi:hypothetical protein
LRFLLKIFFFFSKYYIDFPIYLVEVPFLFSMLEIVILVLTSLFLKSLFKIVVETSNYLNQLGPIF